MSGETGPIELENILSHWHERISDAVLQLLQHLKGAGSSEPGQAWAADQLEGMSPMDELAIMVRIESAKEQAQ